MTDVRTSILIIVGLFLAVISGIAAMLAGLGSRWGWWHFRTGFIILKWSAYAGVAAAVVSGIGLLESLHARLYDGLVLSLIGLVIGIIVSGNTWTWKQSIHQLPPIHDITTDTADPPRFVAILRFRKDAPNPAEYGGPELAAQQLRAYPDLAPLVMKAQPAAAFERALDVARSMRWKIIDANKNEGRIEAVDTTFWFGFKDDIVIRIMPQGAGSRIDVRSVSRVGKSDVGKNARRIRTFLKSLKNS